MTRDLCRGVSTGKRTLNELEKAGLLRRHRVGLSKANRLFLMLPDGLDLGSPESQKLDPPKGPKVGRQEGPKVGRQEGPIWATNDTNRELTKENDTKREREGTPSRFGCYQNISLSEQERDFPERLNTYIETLSAYRALSGKTYACHEAVLRRWLTEDKPEPKPCGVYTDADYADYEEGECL